MKSKDVHELAKVGGPKIAHLRVEIEFGGDKTSWIIFHWKFLEKQAKPASNPSYFIFLELYRISCEFLKLKQQSFKNHQMYIYCTFL